MEIILIITVIMMLMRSARCAVRYWAIPTTATDSDRRVNTRIQRKH